MAKVYPSMKSGANPTRLASQGSAAAGGGAAKTTPTQKSGTPSQVSSSKIPNQSLRAGKVRSAIGGVGQGPNQGASLPHKSLKK